MTQSTPETALLEALGLPHLDDDVFPSRSAGTRHVLHSLRVFLRRQSLYDNIILLPCGAYYTTPLSRRASPGVDSSPVLRLILYLRVSRFAAMHSAPASSVGTSAVWWTLNRKSLNRS